MICRGGSTDCDAPTPGATWSSRPPSRPHHHASLVPVALAQEFAEAASDGMWSHRISKVASRGTARTAPGESNQRTERGAPQEVEQQRERDGHEKRSREVEGVEHAKHARVVSAAERAAGLASACAVLVRSGPGAPGSTGAACAVTSTSGVSAAWGLAVARATATGPGACS